MLPKSKLGGFCIFRRLLAANALSSNQQIPFAGSYKKKKQTKELHRTKKSYKRKAKRSRMPACHPLRNSSSLPERYGAVPVPPCVPPCLSSRAPTRRAVAIAGDSRCSNVGGNCSHAQLLRTQPFMVFLAWKLLWFVALCLLSSKKRARIPPGLQGCKSGAQAGDEEANPGTSTLSHGRGAQGCHTTANPQAFPSRQRVLGCLHHPAISEEWGMPVTVLWTL